MKVKEYAGVLAKLQLSYGRVQCVHVQLFDKWPGPDGYRCWWAVLYSIEGPSAMRRLKFAVHRTCPEMIPYIKDWEVYPPELP